MHAFTQRLNAGQTPEAPDVEHLLHALWSLRSLAEVSMKPVTSWVAEGHAMHYFLRPAKKANLRAQALIILTFLHSRPDGTNGNASPNASGGDRKSVG